MAKYKSSEWVRDHNRNGNLNHALDNLGRVDARDAAPRYVDFMDDLVNEVKGRTGQGSTKRPERNDAPPSSLFLAEGELPELIAQLSETEYWIDGVLVDRDELQQRVDLAVKLERQRRQDFEHWQAKEDHARGNRQWAQWDMNILSVIVQKMSARSA